MARERATEPAAPSHSELKQIFLSIQTEIKRKYPEGIEQYTSVSYVPTTRKSESRFLSWLVLCLTQALCTTAMPRAHTGRNHASGFIFLRFFCPAILNPALFGLSNGWARPRSNGRRALAGGARS